MENNTPSNSNMIPLPLFFAKASKDQMRLSPLGTYLGYRSRDKDNGVLHLWVQHRATGKERQITFERERDVCLLYWFSCDDKTLIYLREHGKNGSELYHLYAIDLQAPEEYDETDEPNFAGQEPRDLIGDASITCAMGFAGGLQVWLDPQQPRRIYAATAPCGIRSMFWSIRCIDMDTGDCALVEANPLATWHGLVWFIACTVVSMAMEFLGVSGVPQPRATAQWFPDANMNFRGRLEISLVDLSCAWSVRGAENSRGAKEGWKTFYECTWADANMSLVGSSGGSGTAHIGFSKDGSTVDLHVCGNGDTTSYEQYNEGTGEYLQKLACHPRSDITGFLRDPMTGTVQGVKYNFEKPTVKIFSGCPKALQNDFEYLQTHFKEAAFSIVSRTLDDKTWLVHAQSDMGLSQAQNSTSGYFMFKRSQEASKKLKKGSSLQFLMSPQSDMAKYELGTMSAVHIPARDGEDLLCYLSRPSGSKSSTTEKPTPMVLLIHGGPQARDVWQYHPLCQLLVNRGFSVLQVNYRGSTGLGTRFMKLGMDGAFAKGVQEDIQDAAAYAVRKKWCSPDRIAIMGGSFGGYCALAAMTFMNINGDNTNPRYQCAVAICPPSIMGAANPHKAFYGNPVVARYWRQVYGKDIATNQEASKRVSPLYQTDMLRRPVLLLHGEDDPRVPIEQSNDLALKLQANREEASVGGSEYVRFAKEGHGIRKEQNVLYMYHRIEKFLCRHLKMPNPPDLEKLWVDGHTGTDISASEQTKDMVQKHQFTTVKWRYPGFLMLVGCCLLCLSLGFPSVSILSFANADTTVDDDKNGKTTDAANKAVESEILEAREQSKKQQCAEGDDTCKVRMVTVEELSTKNGEDGGKVLWLSILGQVYDVSAGPEYYAPGSGYHIFAGRDATVPFVTGNFTEEESQKHTDELTAAQLYALDQEWGKFYAKEERYHFVGYLCCRYYDADGQPTEETLRVAERVKSYEVIRAAKKKERAEKRKLKMMTMTSTTAPTEAPATAKTTPESK